MALYLLTEEDQKTLKEMAQAWRDGRLNPPTKISQEYGFTEGQDYMAPEVYVAKVLEDGIPGMTTDASTPYNDLPGEAICDIYRILPGVAPSVGNGYATEPELYQVVGLKQRVHNVFRKRLHEDNYFPVARDKFGKWLALPCTNVEIAWATLYGTGAVATTDTEFEVTDIVPFEGGTWAGADPLTVKNDPDEYEIVAAERGKIIFCFDDDDEWAWHPLDFPC